MDNDKEICLHGKSSQNVPKNQLFLKIASFLGLVGKFFN